MPACRNLVPSPVVHTGVSLTGFRSSRSGKEACEVRRIGVDPLRHSGCQECAARSTQMTTTAAKRRPMVNKAEREIGASESALDGPERADCGPARNRGRAVEASRQSVDCGNKHPSTRNSYHRRTASGRETVVSETRPLLWLQTFRRADACWYSSCSIYERPHRQMRDNPGLWSVLSSPALKWKCEFACVGFGMRAWERPTINRKATAT